MAHTINDLLVVVDSSGRKVFEFEGSHAVLDLGAQGNEGDLRLRGNDGEFTFHFDGGRQLLIVRDSAGRDVLHFDGANSLLQVGAQGNEGDIFVRDNSGQTSIHLDGGAGDIILRNADCAEEFDTTGSVPPAPGVVVVLDATGAVAPCTEPYDHRVAGVVSGAGEYRPAIVLDRRGTSSRVPVALMGKVSCLIDATREPVAAGDLLTTSARCGHAMKATDAQRMVGALIGKAMRPLADGTGLVPILISLH